MYQIKANSNFFLEHIIKLLNQRNFPLIKNQIINDYGTIEFIINKNNISLKFNNSEVNIKKPFDLNTLWNSLDGLLSNHKISFDYLFYYPMKEYLKYQNNNLKLTHTHNLIIQEILQNQDSKISKNDIYKKIWPNDVNIQINKLDTHLTNLKNTLYDQFSYELKFSSTGGFISFLIN